MRLPLDPTCKPSLIIFKDFVKHPDPLWLRAARTESKASVTTADDRSYFRARSADHERLAAEAKHSAARAAHLELAERYYERSLEQDDGAWLNEGGSWQ